MRPSQARKGAVRVASWVEILVVAPGFKGGKGQFMEEQPIHSAMETNPTGPLPLKTSHREPGSTSRVGGGGAVPCLSGY